jgi:hypothetical protein
MPACRAQYQNGRIGAESGLGLIGDEKSHALFRTLSTLQDFLAKALAAK